MIKISFIKESLLFTIGNALPMAASVLLLPFYANYLNPTNYVALSFYIGISLLFQILFSFSFDQYYGVVFTEIKQDISKVKLLNGSVFLYLIFQGIAIILVSILTGDLLLRNIFKKQIPVVFYPYGFLSILTGFCNALFKVSMSTFIYEQKPKLFFIANFTNFLATVSISLSGLFLYPDTLIGPIYGRFLSVIVILVFNIILMKNKIKWQIEWQFIKEFVQKSWALFAFGVMNWIVGNVDRYFLKNYVDVNDLASYDLILKCFIGIEFIQNGLSMAIISKVFDIWNKNKKLGFTIDTNRYFNIFISVITFAVLVFILILPFFIKWIIYDEKYYQLFSMIGLIGTGFIIRTLMYPYNFALLYAKKTSEMFIANMWSVLIQLILSYLFIPVYGLIAAVLIGIFVKLIGVSLYHYYTIKYIEKNKVNYWKWYGITFLICALIGLFYLIKIDYRVSNILVVLIFAILFFIVYRNELKIFLNDIKTKCF